MAPMQACSGLRMSGQRGGGPHNRLVPRCAFCMVLLPVLMPALVDQIDIQQIILNQLMSFISV